MQTFPRQIDRNATLVGTALRDMTNLVPGSRRKGRGMMQGIDVGSGELAAKISALCFERGLIIETSGAYDEVLKVLAAVNTPTDVLIEGLAVLRQAIVDVGQPGVAAAPASTPVFPAQAAA